jgi:putative spermidine/putrescine transport system substrate-binding protein
LQPKVSSQISLFTSGTAPLFTSINPSEILSDIRQDSLILPPKNILDRSEFIYPLSSTSQSQSDRLWQEVNRLKSR